jgi:hypothetical protein
MRDDGAGGVNDRDEHADRVGLPRRSELGAGVLLTAALADFCSRHGDSGGGLGVGVVSFTFVDGYAARPSQVPLLAERGMKRALYVNTNKITPAASSHGLGLRQSTRRAKTDIRSTTSITRPSSDRGASQGMRRSRELVGPAYHRGLRVPIRKFNSAAGRGSRRVRTSNAASGRRPRRADV